MKIGLVLGKFYPLHMGHLALIRFAKTQCDMLFVGLSPDEGDYPVPTRFEWLKEECIKIGVTAVMLDDEPAHDENYYKGIEKNFTKACGRLPDVMISSEFYGISICNHIGIEHVMFNQERTLIPISGTKIRSNPLKYWDYIALSARPYFVKKVCIYGAESTGKTTLSMILAHHYRTVKVNEYGRLYLEKKDETGVDLKLKDFDEIAIGHDILINEMSQYANKVMFVDTDAMTTMIYSKHYLNDCSSYVEKFVKERKYDQYILTTPDIPQIADKQRDCGDIREYMDNLFESELKSRNINYSRINGSFQERLDSAIKVVDNLLGL